MRYPTTNIPGVHMNGKYTDLPMYIIYHNHPDVSSRWKAARSTGCTGSTASRPCAAPPTKEKVWWTSGAAAASRRSAIATPALATSGRRSADSAGGTSSRAWRMSVAATNPRWAGGVAGQQTWGDVECSRGREGGWVRFSLPRLLCCCYYCCRYPSAV